MGHVHKEPVDEALYTWTTDDHVYTYRVMTMDDQTFYNEATADFPVEHEGFSYADMFEALVQNNYDCPPQPLAVGSRMKITYIFAVDNDDVAVYSSVTFRDETGTYSSDSFTAVHPDHRGQGYYSKLLKLLEQITKKFSTNFCESYNATYADVAAVKHKLSEAGTLSNTDTSGTKTVEAYRIEKAYYDAIVEDDDVTRTMIPADPFNAKWATAYNTQYWIENGLVDGE